MTRTNIIDGLEDSASKTLRHFDAPESDLAKSYGPGKWTVRQILMHLADDEVVSLWRCNRAIAEPGCLVYGFDENKWAAALQYATRPVPTAKAIFAANRQRMLEIVREAPEAALENRFNHSERGEYDLRRFLELVIWHTDHHLEQIAAAREGRIWTPSK